MPTLMSGARMLLECLVREGVDCFFGIPGGVTIPLYDAMYDHPIRHILVRNEENAAFMASGYARSTGRVGVCCATSGPGATNLVTGLVDALMDSIPMVAITGQVASKLIGSGRVPGSRHVRHFALLHQAQLPGEEHRGSAAGDSRGLLRRLQRPARPGAGGYSQGRVSRPRRTTFLSPPSTCPATKCIPRGTPDRSAAPRK